MPTFKLLQDIDFIVMTGDYPPHDIWAQTMDSNIEHVRVVMTEIGNAFPGVPIYPALGNHEPSPSNKCAHEFGCATCR